MKQQASNLKKLSFTLLTVFLITNVISQISSAAVTRLPQINLSPRTRAAATEGTICADCASRSSQSSLMQNLAQIQSVQSGTERLFNAAYLNDDNDRQSLNALRRRKANGETLTAEENAILVAGNKTGLVVWPNCINPATNQPLSGNAFLVQIEGKDSIVTSAHEVTEASSGKLRNNCDLSDLTNAVYYPNASYMDPTRQIPSENSPIRQTVAAVPDPRFGGYSSRNRISIEDDWMILNLDPSNSTSQGLSIDGTPRGFFQFAPPSSQIRDGYIIGFDSRYTQQNGGKSSSYQKCETRTSSSIAYHTCDTDVGSSSSIFGIMQNNEIMFESINSENSSSLSSDGEHETPRNFKDWNRGLSSQYILNQINSLITHQSTET